MCSERGVRGGERGGVRGGVRGGERGCEGYERSVREGV